MAISGTLVDTKGTELGVTHQHDTETLVDIWGWLKADITAESATSVTVGVRGSMFYNGYDNYIPWEIGVFKVTEGATTINGFSNGGYDQGALTRSTPMWTGGTVGSGGWAWYNFGGDHSFTINKTSNTRFGIMPYMKIGALYKYGQYGDSGSGSYWQWGNSYGILCADSYKQSGYMSGMTYGGKVIDGAFTLLGGSSNTYTWTYANCPKKVDPLNPVFVRDSNGAPHRATALYVYDGSGVRRKAVSITIYDANGKPHTMKC